MNDIAIPSKESYTWFPAALFIGGALASLLIGYFAGGYLKAPWMIGSACAFLWSGFYFYKGFKIVQEMDVLIIERWGKYAKICRPGWHILCFPGLFDHIAAKISMQYQEIPIFADDYTADFKDCSTKIKGTASVRVGDYKPGNAEEEKSAILKYHYTMPEAERKQRIEQLFEKSIGPKLQERNITDALTKKGVIGDEAAEEVRDSLKAIGVELNSSNGVIITDIILPDSVIKQREKVLQGEMEAKKQKEQGSGYMKAILAIIEDGKAAGQIITFAEARAIYEQQRGLETLAGLGNNITFVSPDIKGVTTMIDMNKGAGK